MKGFAIGLILGGLLATAGSLWATSHRDPLVRIERHLDEIVQHQRQQAVEQRIHRVLGREC